VKNPKVIAGLVVGVLFVIFLFQNMEPIPLQFYFWQRSMPKIILISLAILVGFVAGFAVAKITGGLENLQLKKISRLPLLQAPSPPTPESRRGKEGGPHESKPLHPDRLCCCAVSLLRV